MANLHITCLYRDHRNLILDNLDDESAISFLNCSKQYRLFPYTLKEFWESKKITRYDYTKIKNVTEIKEINRKITHIIFHPLFHRGVDDLHDFYNIKFITFGYRFNLPVDHLPINITHLTFSSDFNQRVDNLPEHLICLTFGWSFNQPVDNLPANLGTLTFGCHFNHPVDNLPTTLNAITFGQHFDQQLTNLPRNLTHLFLTGFFNQHLDNLPDRKNTDLNPHKILIRSNYRANYLDVD